MITKVTELAMLDQHWRYDYQRHKAGDAELYSAGAMIPNVTEPAMLDQRWRHDYQRHRAGDAGPALAP